MTRLFILFLFTSGSIVGQKVNTTNHSGKRNIYNDAIKQYILHGTKKDKSTNDTVLILKDDLVTDSLLSKIQGSVIILLDSTEIAKRLKFDSSFIALQLFPLQFDKGKFYISIVPFGVYQENFKIIMANGGTCVASYIYISDKKEFKFERYSCFGI